MRESHSTAMFCPDYGAAIANSTQLNYISGIEFTAFLYFYEVIEMKKNRREFLKAGVATGATLAAPAVLAQQNVIGQIEQDPANIASSNSHRYNNSTFRTQVWSDHFNNTNGGAILVDIDSYALHYWNGDRSIYRLYPIAIPLRDEFAKRGYTSVIRKVDGPSWSPTTSMLQRDPTLPKYVEPGPKNPLGTHALYLGWQYYRIHGNNDQRKIGRRSSNGCIGLFNEDIKELFALSDVGCQVKMI